MITIAIRLRYDYDPTTTYRARLLPFDAIRREQKIEHVSFSSQSCRSRIAVESQLRNTVLSEKKRIVTVVWPQKDIDVLTSLVTENASVSVVANSQFQSVCAELEPRAFIVSMHDCSHHQHD